MKRTKHKNINGWIVIDKPQGMGSTEVVNITRRLLDANKNGHTGTLDPFATGVLPIAFGEATKLIAYVTDGKKEYEFVLKFGFDTTTDDLQGEPVHTGGRVPSKDELLRILPAFVGKIKQTPPAYSAIKIGGVRAYKLAREGKNFEIAEREVEIYSLDFLKQVSDDSFQFKVCCSKGTYIRTLGKDIALKLQSYGHLTALRRTRCANFSISDTILLENLKNMVYEKSEQGFLMPVQTVLRDIAALAVSAEDAFKLRLGQRLSATTYGVSERQDEVLAAFEKDCLTALVRVEGKAIVPIRVFNLSK
ncbi:MAG: tRNA pseudouridine(55) synthase TruB [Alphaproteobacteria bacterium]|nr:tRNA pseudouridine(55) synthase TruB [Alphaproteobacteria bacterium]